MWGWGRVLKDPVGWTEYAVGRTTWYCGALAVPIMLSVLIILLLSSWLDQPTTWRLVLIYVLILGQAGWIPFVYMRTIRALVLERKKYASESPDTELDSEPTSAS